VLVTNLLPISSIGMSELIQNIHNHVCIEANPHVSVLLFERFARRGLIIISSSFMQGEEHFTFQTPWMKERHLVCGQN
jgi:hypothetical protein